MCNYRLKVWPSGNVGETSLQIIEPCTIHDAWAHGVAIQWQTQQESHILQRGSYLPTREVERVGLRPPPVN